VAGPIEPIIGIDLGTSYTSVSTILDGRVRLLADDTGSVQTPSVIGFPSKSQILVGHAARARLATDPLRTVASPKRLLGRAFEDREVQTFLAQSPWKSSRGPDGTALAELWGQPYSFAQLCAYILSEARGVAERRLARPVTHAALSVPVSFGADRVAAVTRAAQLAGLTVTSTVVEPTAAALANRHVPGFGGIVAVYDFGGGTFDCSIVDVSHGSGFRVLATAGDTWLGGDDLDLVIAEAAANQFWRQHKVDLRKQAVEWQRLKFACEQAKRTLSTEQIAFITVPDVLRTASGMVSLELQIDRPTLARAARGLLDRSLAVCDQALREAGVDRSRLTGVYLSGGTCHMPVVHEAVGRHFGVPVRVGVAPDHAVCIGATIHAAARQVRPVTGPFPVPRLA
jgi:molecular chaperone DnaK